MFLQGMMCTSTKQLQNKNQKVENVKVKKNVNKKTSYEIQTKKCNFLTFSWFATIKASNI